MPGKPRGISVEPPSTQSSALVYYESCDSLLTDLRASLDAEMTARLLNADRYYSNDIAEGDDGAMDGSAEPTTGDMAAGDGAQGGDDRVEGEDFSGTNNH